MAAPKVKIWLCQKYWKFFFLGPCYKVFLASIWLLGFIIAAVPLMNEEVFGNYYGRNGVCFPLHSERQEKPTAKGYSTGIFLGKLERKKTIIFLNNEFVLY